MTLDLTDVNYQFLVGAGEMATLTRGKDWSKTPVGPIDNWPQSLRTSLSIVLNSKFPMFLWWGPQLTCFYNDAYRPSLGKEGKHPGILGMPAKEAWPEIWDIIKPLIDQVLHGNGATWSEDQLIPIFRNGKIEDVYWTFSYSPVNDESGKIAGVLVTCSETTEKIQTFNRLEEINKRYLNNILQAPAAMCIFKGKEHIVEIANTMMLNLWGKTAEDVMNKPIFEGLPEAKGQGLENLIDTVFTTGNKYSETERAVNLPRNGKIETVYVNFVWEALKEPDGTITGIMAIASEVTGQVLARKKVEESEKRFRETVKQAPVGITILRGPKFIVEIANDSYLQLIDKKENEFVGKPLFESLPEVEEAVHELLDKVLQTGIPFHGVEYPIPVNRYGKFEVSYFDFLYHPLKEEDGTISGIIVTVTDVSESVKAKHFISESEKQFRSLITQSPIPMAILRGNDHIIEMANTAMFDRWKKRGADVLGKKILEEFPELNDQKYPAILKKVLASGQPHREVEASAYIKEKDSIKTYYIDYEYAPLREPDGKVSGIIVTVNDVTEKVEARKKVENAEARLRIATDATELSTWDLDLQSREIIHSQRLAEIFGHDRSKKIDHHQMRDQIHPDDIHTIVEKAFDRAMKTSVYEYEARVVKPNKEICWIKTQGKVFYSEENKPVKMIGTLRDITKEKHREQELKESEEKFRLLADSMPQHIWTADTQGNLNYFNRSVFDYSGLTPEQINKDGWLQIVHPDDRDENIKQWTHSITTGEDFLFEHRFRRHDGKYHWQLSRAIPQRDSDGKIQMWVGTSTDIQNQKTFTSELEEKVQERTKELVKSEERYHLMVEEVQDYAILYLNREGIVENWNKGAERIKGYKEEEIIGKSFSVFYTDSDREDNLPQKLLARAVDSGKAVQEGWRVRKDKSLFWASIVITAVHNDENKVIGFSKVTHDLTEKKAATDKLKSNAEQLEQKNRELEKMNSELQSFAYVSSHDLQEPLRKIQTFASRIIEKEESHLSETGKDYFRRMQESAARMQTLIQDLLMYSRTSTSDRVFTNINLGEIVKEVENELKEIIHEKQAVIELHEMCKANIIVFQFRQLMHNLIGNALKFSIPTKPPRIIIKSLQVKGKNISAVSLLPDKMYCHITVSDNGIGFDLQYKERIFEVFQRLHRKGEYEGTGIGLAIVKKIVENHHGKITVNSEPNMGTTFDIYFPVQQTLEKE